MISEKIEFFAQVSAVRSLTKSGNIIHIGKFGTYFQIFFSIRIHATKLSLFPEQ